MHWSDISFSPSNKVLRQFAGLWLLFFGALAVWQTAYHHRPTAGLALAVLAGVIGTAGLVRPALVRWIYVGWMIAAFPIGWIVSRAIVAIVFVAVFTPIAVVFRVMGRDALRRRRPTAGTLWMPVTAPSDVRSYFRQY